MKITFVIPTLNEEKGVAATIASIPRRRLQGLGHKVDVLIVDGGSTDATVKVAEAAGAAVLVDHRRGYGRAYKTGLAAATGEVIVTGDADGTYPFEQVPDLVAQLEQEGLDFITCNRYGRLHDGAMTPKHRLGNWVLSATARALFRVRVRDSQSGMWVIRRAALARLPVASFRDGMAFSQEIKIEAFKRKDIRAIEVASELRPRVGEAVIASWRDGWANYRALWRKRFTTRW